MHLENRKVRQLKWEWCIRISHLSHHTAWKKFALLIVLFSSSPELDAASVRVAAVSSSVGCIQGILLTKRLQPKPLKHFLSSKCLVQIPVCICAAQFTFLQLTCSSSADVSLAHSLPFLHGQAQNPALGTGTHHLALSLSARCRHSSGQVKHSPWQECDSLQQPPKSVTAFLSAAGVWSATKGLEPPSLEELQLLDDHRDLLGRGRRNPGSGPSSPNYTWEVYQLQSVVLAGQVVCWNLSGSQEGTSKSLTCTDWIVIKLV